MPIRVGLGFHVAFVKGEVMLAHEVVDWVSAPALFPAGGVLDKGGLGRVRHFEVER